MPDMMGIFYSLMALPAICLAGFIIWLIWSWIKDAKDKRDREKRKRGRK